MDAFFRHPHVIRLMTLLDRALDLSRIIFYGILAHAEVVTETEAENLEAARVRHRRPVPVHELVDAPAAFTIFSPGWRCK